MPKGALRTSCIDIAENVANVWKEKVVCCGTDDQGGDGWREGGISHLSDVGSRRSEPSQQAVR